MKFGPDIVGISAGFDAHHADPLLNLNYSLVAYYRLGRLLNKNFRNIFALLEGGYNLSYLYKCVANLHAGIEGNKMPCREEPTLSHQRVVREYRQRINKLEEFCFEQ